MTAIEPGDAVALLSSLVRIDSRNPDLCQGTPGEGAIGHHLAQVLTRWGFRVELQEVAPGRGNVIARIGPSGGASLMFNGHLDVVDVGAMTHPPFEATIHNGKLYGRGSSDMKGGVAAMCAAASRVAPNLRCELVVAAVVDEEFASLGTRALVASGVRTDAAIVTEPTRLAIGPAHRGFAWVELEFRGRAAHGSRYDLGVDAVMHAAAVLTELERFEQSVLAQRTHALLGHASIHASTVEGGVGWSTYPDRCIVRLERRTLPGETTDSVLKEISDVCDRVNAVRSAFEVSIRHVLTQAPSDVPVDAPVVKALGDAMHSCGVEPRVAGVTAWTDAAILNDAGIPAICFGPGDMSLAHADEEWISLDEVERATAVLARLAEAWGRD